MSTNPFVYEVRVGQVWNIDDTFGRPPIKLRVDRLEVGRAICTVLKRGDVEGKRDFVVKLRVLTHGFRHAKLVAEAPGTPPQVRPAPAAPKVERVRTASELVKTKKPKGAATASPRMREAHRMRHEEGKSLDEVAEHFGVAKYLISQWCSKVEEALHSERILARTGS